MATEARVLQSFGPWWAWLAPVMSEDLLFQDMAQGLSLVGRAACRATLTGWLSRSFHACGAELDAITVGSEHVTLNLTFHGRHRGRFAGIPATGRRVRLALVVRLGLQGGRIQRLLLAYDAAELLHQLGLTYRQGDAP